MLDDKPETDVYLVDELRGFENLDFQISIHGFLSKSADFISSGGSGGGAAGAPPGLQILSF